MSTFPESRASLSTSPLLREAREFLWAHDPWVLERQMELTSIPAPPFQEGARGQRMLENLRDLGMSDAARDEVGNVTALFPSGGKAREGPEARPLILSAHLDTVFPPGTDVTPRQEEDRILAPGIADDGRGLAALLALVRVVRELRPTLPFPLLFVATVGEEGVGDLRGVRHLFRHGGPGREARGFISLDGVGLDKVIHRGVGSLRYRLRLEGSGGHSWADWGAANPIHVLARIVTHAQAMTLPTAPRTTLTVARWGGGKSVNALPQEAWAEVDLRSEGEEELEGLGEELLSLVRREAADHGDDLHLEVEALGHRPAGRTPPEADLVRVAREATLRLGVEPVLASSSTDANVPMALGIAAITLGAGGEAGGIHTLDEWYRNRKGPEGILRALLTVLLLAETTEETTPAPPSGPPR